MKKLNKKKGFTLIELIVVIAIIAVLAMILVPTMLGYVLKSQVTNANAAASKMRESVSYFLTQANADGFGMFVSQSAVCDVDVTISGGDWYINTSDPTVFIARGAVKWRGSGDTTKPPSSSTAEDRLANYLADLFRDVDTGHAEFKLVGGVCFALYFTTQTSSDISELPGFGDGQPWSVDFYSWDGQYQGITQSGYIVGTSPVLQIA